MIILKPKGKTSTSLPVRDADYLLALKMPSGHDVQRNSDDLMS